MKSADPLAAAALALIWAAFVTLLAPFILVSPITIFATLYGLACAWDGAFADSSFVFDFAAGFYQLLLRLSGAIFVALGIGASVVLVVGLRRGEIADPVRALRRFARWALLPAACATMLGASWVGWSARVETTLVLSCEAGDYSCMSVEPVRSRGLPAPYLQRRFEPGVFLYDLTFATLVAALPVSVLTWALRRRRPAETAHASTAHASTIARS